MVTIQRRNLAPNPSFETTILGCSVTAGTGGVAAVSRQTSGGMSGSGFLRATWTTASTAAGTVVACGAGYRAVVTPLGLLSVSLYVRASVVLSLRPVATTSTAITGGTTTIVNGGYVSCPAGVWTRLAVTLTPAAGRGFLEVAVQSQVSVPVSTTLDVDSLLIETGAALGTYFDGSTAAIQMTPDGQFREFAWVGTAHASQSTQTLTDPLISVERLPDDGPPQAGVTLTGTGEVLVEVSTDGMVWEKVRDGKQTLVGGGFVRDHIPPLNVTTTYRVTMGLESYTTTILIESDVAWLQDPLSPRSAVPVTCVRDGLGLSLQSPSFGTMSRPQAVDYAIPMGDSLPVASVGKRRAPSNMHMHLRAAAQAQATLVKAISKLLDEAGVVVLRGLPADLGLPAVVHVVAPNLQDSPIVGGLLGPRRDWVMTVDQVAAPASRIAVPWWTYAQVRAAWVASLGPGVTYADTLAARPGWTYLRWLAEPTP